MLKASIKMLVNGLLPCFRGIFENLFGIKIDFIILFGKNNIL